MKKTVLCVVDAAIYLIIFFLLQLVCTLLAVRICADGTVATVSGMAASTVLTIAVFHFARFSPLGVTFIRTRPCSLLAWLALLAAALIAPLQFVGEMIPADMPSEMVETLSRFTTRPLGFLVIGILAPIAEEMVFRGAILRRLLSCVPNPWFAVAVSAALFGAVHGNVPQFVHAMLVGMLLGWLYWRTGSILPGLVVHWVNNSLALLISAIVPGSVDATLPELFGGNLPMMYSVIAVSTVIAALSLWQTARKI